MRLTNSCIGEWRNCVRSWKPPPPIWGISEIYESFSEDDANSYFVVSGTRMRAGNEEVGPIYVLGKPAVRTAKVFLNKR